MHKIRLLRREFIFSDKPNNSALLLENFMQHFRQKHLNFYKILINSSEMSETFHCLLRILYLTHGGII